MGSLHPNGRIPSNGRGKPPRVSQIDSPPCWLWRDVDPLGTMAPMSSPDPLLIEIAQAFEDLDVVKARGGYTLYDRAADRPVARLKPIPDTDRFELLYWSLAKEGWRTFGDFGRLRLTLERAHEIFRAEPIFRIPVRR